MARQNKESKVRRLRFAVLNDESHKELWVRSMSKGRFAVVLTTIIVFVLAAIFSLIAFTPIRTFIPGYPDARSRREAISNAMKIDSLETAIARWEFYTDNLMRVVEGREPISLDSLITAVSDTSISKKDVDLMLKKDSLLRVKVASEEKFAVSGKNRSMTIEGLQFFTPVKGVISRPYDSVMHPFLDVTAPSGSVIMSVLDGYVIDAYWSDEKGCSTVIQHDNNIVSVYRSSQKNLKKTGDKVSAGTPIAIIGDHLHLEVWYKGEAVDPSKYINF